MTAKVDRGRAVGAVRELLSAYGLDPDAAQLAETPGRVADTFATFFAGVGVDPTSVLGDPLPVGEATGEVIVMRDMKLRSVCEHHLLPFHGTASIAYLPRNFVVGLSALPRLVDAVAAKPQLQERLGEEIAAALETGIDARGVLVVIEASHGCVVDRNLAQRDARTVTLTSRGELRDPQRRLEALTLMGRDAAASEESR